MDFLLDKIETKIECFQEYDFKLLEQKIEEQINNNKALLLDVHAVQHHVTFDPNRNKMLYTAVVHFKLK
ncbi:DUF2536 family protein [Paenibacillus cremeus]|uniref:DUF2536 family protein n=1 Tax=Paenibacillus cremeus TaxID=2163881 RepID=A0A559KI07_9BACL|nr:DUF2536 family protein [Paenibacillus cremeus]TVY11762.1 DUF2536 family protein [Paenibacillus cremeus]